MENLHRKECETCATIAEAVGSAPWEDGGQVR
jgi:hypothetical protein